jgi:hypothetical protein
MTLLTDTEQKKLLAELYNTTRTKIETVLKKYRLDKVPDEVEALRKEQAKRHKIDGWKFLRTIAAKVAGDIDTFSK